MNGLPRDALRPPERGTERLLAPVPGAPYEPDPLKRLSEALRDASLAVQRDVDLLRRPAA